MKIINYTLKILMLLNVIFFIDQEILFAKTSKAFVVIKIDNEIITNIDIKREYKYLIALNNDLKKLEKKEIIQIAKNSLIREKIKKKELIKFFNFEMENQYFDKVIQDFYLKLGIKDENSFKEYLMEFDLTMEEVEEKLKIETFWNELIFGKYQEQVEIDLISLKKKVEEMKLSSSSIEYFLSEILFTVKNSSEINEKFNKIKDGIEMNGFKNTANQYSVSDTSKFGGKIGWINEQQLSKNIIQELKKITVNKITEPITVAGGILILRLDDKKISTEKLDPKEQLDKLIMSEKNRQLNQFSTLFFNRIKQTSKIDEL